MREKVDSLTELTRGSRGLNYRAHADELKLPYPKNPVAGCRDTPDIFYTLYYSLIPYCYVVYIYRVQYITHKTAPVSGLGRRLHKVFMKPTTCAAGHGDAIASSPAAQIFPRASLLVNHNHIDKNIDNTIMIIPILNFRVFGLGLGFWPQGPSVSASRSLGVLHQPRAR